MHLVVCVVKKLPIVKDIVGAAIRSAIRVAVGIVIGIERIDGLQPNVQQTRSENPPGWRDREATEIQRQPEQIAQKPEVTEPRITAPTPIFVVSESPVSPPASTKSCVAVTEAARTSEPAISRSRERRILKSSATGEASATKIRSAASHSEPRSIHRGVHKGRTAPAPARQASQTCASHICWSVRAERTAASETVSFAELAPARRISEVG